MFEMFKSCVFLLAMLSIGPALNVNADEFQSAEILELCQPEDFQCTSGKCIASVLECDGKEDCPDGGDENEMHCELKTCKSPKYYTCKDVNKTCIGHNFVCDGHYDCPTNDDEENCTEYQPYHELIECNPDEFTCLTDNMCIGMEYMCDGIRHCIDGSDESMGCLNIEKKCKGFLCKNNHCLTDKTWICDGTDDCGDGSDEKNCVTDCTAVNKKFLCGDNVTCLSIENVCDRKKDCVDGLDEGGICDKFSNNTACEQHYCPDNAECFIWPTGPVCVCPKGFSYNLHKKICEDNDECQTYGICSQGCINTPGSYSCTCERRFRLKNDQKTCESISHTEPILLYAGKNAINMVYLRSNHQTVVTEKVRQVIGVSYDGHFVYWTNIALNSESLVKAREDGSRMETLLTTGLSLPEDIAVDWITGNLYFTDAMYMHIAVCSNDGKHCTSLISENVEKPRSIALYPQEGRMYWSEWGSEPMIAVAHMDGSFSAPFVRENILWPSGITLDWPNNRVYWVDAKLNRIESCNFDGTGRRTVIEHVLKHPYGLAVFEDNIYWSDWNAKSVETCNKFTCKQRRTIVKDRKVYDLHIYHNSIQPITNNPCKNNQCTHLCLLASNATFTCGCPTGMTLNIDQISCSPTTKKESIFIGMRNYLITMDHEVFGRHQIEKARVLPMYINKMVFNLLNGHVFIADNIAKIIYDYDYDHDYTKELVTRNVGHVTSMAFDHLSNNLYWTDSEHGTIEMLSLNKNHRAIVHHYAGMAKPIAITVVPENGQMFVASRTTLGHTHIDLQPLHGNGDHHHIIESHLGDKHIQFAVDRQLGDVYFCDSDMRQISFTDYTGQSLHVFKRMSSEPTSIAVLTDDVFWTKNNSLDVFWTPKHSPDTTKQLILPPHEYVTKDDGIVIVAATTLVVGHHPCMFDNGGCSHICATYSAVQQICLCPAGMVFTNNQNLTCMEAVDCEFRCGSGECITSSRLCNNFNDCADGSDEHECAKSGKIDVVCYRDEFKCLDGKQCVSIELRCDKTNDCNDKSDEADCVGYNSTTKCQQNQFRCSDGLCIDVTAVCDDWNDCDDGLDELKCHDKEAMKHVCKSSMFSCTSGQCIPAQWVCDESADCKDGSDEHNCPEKTCPKGYLQCGHGRCVDLKLVCDGFNNCGDNTDELNCPKVAENSCEEFDANNNPLKFQCTSDKSICLNVTARCNGSAECPRGEDEAFCSVCRINEFECQNKKCILQDWRCDGANDCGDRSDEIGCANTTAAQEMASNGCATGMFNCKDGNCIYMDLVCNGKDDCPNKMDESVACNTSCAKSPCQQVCNKTPFGPVCSCKDGYALGGDGKSCFDINECKVAEPCAQKCENLEGSFRCSCFAGYMLRSDKVSCKPIGEIGYFLYSSLNVIYNMTLSTLGVLWTSNSSKIAGIDVNIRKKLVYFTVEGTNALYEMNLDNEQVVYVTNIGNPHHVAVDWITDNVYFFDQNTNPSIKICHMARQVCTRIIPLKYRDVVKALVIDSTNNKIFYSVQHPSFSAYDSYIYSHHLDGSRSNIVIKSASEISGLAYDPNKQILYYTDLSTNSVWSVKYDGSDPKQLYKDSALITKPSDLSFHEDHLMILNQDSKYVANCMLYGKYHCKAFAFSAFNIENLVVVQGSLQKEKLNNCHGSNCSLICVPAELGPKCICHGGAQEENGHCKDATSNEVVLMPSFNMLSSTTTKTAPNQAALVATIFTVLGILIASAFVAMTAFFVYQKRFHLRKTFDISMHFENPTCGVDDGQVKMCRQPHLASANHYNEIYVNAEEPIVGPIVEEYDINLTSDSDTTQLIY